MNFSIRKIIFENLFRGSYNKLYKYSICIVGDSDIAKDIVSDAYVKLWETYEFTDSKDAESYLFIAVRNKCLDFLRHKNVANAYIDYINNITQDEITPANWDNYDDRLEHIMNLIHQMPHRTRFVLEQCYIHEKTYKEVGDLLGITPSGVKQHIVKGLATIREYFSRKAVKCV